MRQRLERITGGDSAFPLAVLFAVYFFDEFDTAAFGVLAPEIKRSFGLSDQAFFAVVAANLLVVLAFAIPIGWMGDRLPRRKLVVGGALLAGVCSFLTGAAPGVAWLLLFRIGNGIGILVNDPVHTSLLTDYYRPEVRPTVFATHRNAVRWGMIFGAALAGLLASLFGWRVAFMVLLVPIAVAAAVATRLPEVKRGQSDDAAAAAVAEGEPPIPFEHAVRMLRAVPTLRRQYLAWVPIGAGLLPLAGYIPLYFERVFHLNSFEIGVIVSAGAVAGLVSMQLSGPWTQRYLARGPGEPLVLAAWSLAGVTPFLFVIAVAPSLWVAVPAILAVNLVAGLFMAPFVTVQAMVSPPRARSLSFSFGLLFLALGLIAFAVLLGKVGDDNVRLGIAALSPFWAVGALVLLSARRMVAADAARAVETLEASLVMRRRFSADAAGAPIVALQDVDFSYSGVQVLFGVSLDVQRGEVLALLGTNGAGKSTILRVMTGLAVPDAGEVWFDGHPVTGLPAERLAAEGLVQVPGGKAVFPDLTVRDNLLIGAHLLRRQPKVVAERIEEVLELFPRLRERSTKAAGSLSGGEQQQLALAKAMLLRPKVLCVDELSLGLAPVVVEELLETMQAVRARGTTLVIVEQSLNVAAALCDRAVFLEKGSVRFEGHPSELLARDDIARAVFLGADFVTGGVGR